MEQRYWCADIFAVMGRDPMELQRQIDELLNDGTRTQDSIADLERRADDLEAQAGIDRELIIDLQADGLLLAEHTANLEEALKSSRTIGAAIGLLMGSRNLDEDQACAVLKQVSRNGNRKMRELAAALVQNARLHSSPSDPGVLTTWHLDHPATIGQVTGNPATVGPRPDGRV
jgi:hypothetical protein